MSHIPPSQNLTVGEALSKGAMEVILTLFYADGSSKKAVAVIYKYSNQFSVTAAPKGDFNAANYVHFVSNHVSYMTVFHEIAEKVFKEKCTSLEYTMRPLE